jgi:hypothetical protein
MLIVTVCWQGDLDEAENFMETIRGLGSPIFSSVTRQPLSEFLEVLNALNPPRKQLSTVQTEWMDDLHEETRSTLIRYAETLPPLCFIGIHHLHHSIATSNYQQSSFGGRSAKFMLEIIGSNFAGEDNDNASADAVAWTNSLWRSLRKYGMGRRYTAFLSPDEDFSASYDPQDWSRLVDLKFIYDSGNLFQFGIPNLALEGPRPLSAREREVE